MYKIKLSITTLIFILSIFLLLQSAFTNSPSSLSPSPSPSLPLLLLSLPPLLSFPLSPSLSPSLLSLSLSLPPSLPLPLPPPSLSLPPSPYSSIRGTCIRISNKCVPYFIASFKRKIE